MAAETLHRLTKVYTVKHAAPRGFETAETTYKSWFPSLVGIKHGLKVNVWLE